MEGTNLSTTHDLETFRREGMLTLPQVIDASEITTLRQRFWDEVEETFAIREDAPDTWFDRSHTPPAALRSRRLSGMNPVMERLRSAKALDAAQSAIQNEADRLFGAGRWEPLEKWYSLVSFPGTESNWSVPRTSWHNDEPIVVGDNEPWSIFVFVFLDRVEREMGPTLAITGSHRRGEAIAAEKGVHDEREVRAFEHANGGFLDDPGALRILPVGSLLPELAATDTWFGDLVGDLVGDPAGEGSEDQRLQQFVQTGTVHQGPEDSEVTSRVVDITGNAGDIIMFDPRCLHSYSANVSTLPRQVLRLDLRRTAL